MSYAPKPINEATPEERLIYAKSFLNLEIPDDADEAQVLTLLHAAQPQSEMIFVEESAPEIDRIDPPALNESLTENAARVAGSLGHIDPRAIIHIMKIEGNEGETINDDVGVGVDGRIWQLKRGVDLNVPWRVVEALSLTEQTIIRHNDKGDVIERTSRRIPYTIISQPSPEEIEEWHRKTDGLFCP